MKPVEKSRAETSVIRLSRVEEAADVIAAYIARGLYQHHPNGSYLGLIVDHCLFSPQDKGEILFLARGL